MSAMPRFLEIALWARISLREARQIWDWLQTNSNTVIVDELEQAIRKRRDWTERDEK